ncbi:MAG: hypothetical protein Alpg2KO_13310 [Alphaproteobacteria bacterium]
MPYNKRMITRRRGISLTSYGLLVGLIGVVAIAATTTVGQQTNDLFGTTAQTLNGVNTGAQGGEAAASPAGSAALPSPSASASASPSASPLPSPGTLVPGNTSLTVTRGDLIVRCDIWSGDRCNMPLFSSASGSPPLGNTFWRPYGQEELSAPGNHIAACRLFCQAATGDPNHSYCRGIATGITSNNNRLTGVNSSTNLLTLDGESFRFNTQSTNNQFFNQVECDNW